MIGEVGKRYLFTDLELIRRSHYERIIHHEEQRTIWRHEFQDSFGERIVYSGKWLNLSVGDKVDIRATVKRHELEFHSTRICRPKIVSKNGPKKVQLFA